MTATTDPKRRPGRPRSADPKLAKIEARVSPGQRAKFEALGGADWLRRAIDKARITPAN